MKLLFENWRGFIKEEAMRPSEEHAEAIKSLGLVRGEELGRGKFGVVYEVENPKTGQRMAAKLVSQHIPETRKERANYQWILSNRNKLPEKVSQHLVDVYDIREHKQYLIILMELLQPAPKEVLNQLIVSGKHSQEKEDRIFKDEQAVYKVIMKVLEANKALEPLNLWRGLPLLRRQAAARNILRAHMVGEVPKSTIKHIYDILSIYPISDHRPQWQRLFNAILNEVEQILKEDKPEVDDAVLRFAASSIEEDLARILAKQIVPVSQGAPLYHPHGSTEFEIVSLFPEAKSLMDAMQHMARESFSPHDIHSGNVMMRPSSNQLVIVDVGLFRK
tara:strand:- start:1295 stop:2293 length:999 start_codon:yes stop_codon:yes gene_type:complete